MKYIVLCLAFVYCLGVAKSGMNSKCTTPDNKVGRCKQISKCDDLYKLYKTQQMTNQKLKFLQDSRCGFLVEALVCCSPLLSVGTNIICVHVDKDRIFSTGGKNTKIYEYRWMAHLEYTHKVTKSTERGCAGSIISRRFILTAAHCLVGLGNQKLTSVILGEWDTTTDPDFSEGITADPIKIYKVSKFIVHEDFSRQKKENDIGLVKVTSNIVFSEWITPICVPNSETLKNRDLDGYDVVVVGWGKTSGATNAPTSKIKQKAEITGKSNKECQESYDSISAGVTITDKQFCAGSLGVDSCRGDSGGPAIAIEVIENTVLTYLAGIVSFGPTACGQGPASGVYTKVAAYIPWIEANTV